MTTAVTGPELLKLMRIEIMDAIMIPNSWLPPELQRHQVKLIDGPVDENGEQEGGRSILEIENIMNGTVKFETAAEMEKREREERIVDYTMYADAGEPIHYRTPRTFHNGINKKAE